jgi:hypothetical protein
MAVAAHSLMTMRTTPPFTTVSVRRGGSDQQAGGLDCLMDSSLAPLELRGLVEIRWLRNPEDRELVLESQRRRQLPVGVWSALPVKLTLTCLASTGGRGLHHGRAMEGRTVLA